MTSYIHAASPVIQQGASVKESISIHEWDLPIETREWIWTSITRCVGFQKVRFHDNEEFDEQMPRI